MISPLKHQMKKLSIACMHAWPGPSGLEPCNWQLHLLSLAPIYVSFFVNTHVVTRMTYNFYKLGREGAGRKGGFKENVEPELEERKNVWRPQRTAGKVVARNHTGSRGKPVRKERRQK
jgi:hypothetical protein